MRFMRSRMKMATGLLAICAAFAVCIVSGTYLASVAYGQSLLAGDISGTIVDPNGAAVSGATVKVTSKDTGTTATTITSGTDLIAFRCLAGYLHRCGEREWIQGNNGDGCREPRTSCDGEYCVDPWIGVRDRRSDGGYSFAPDRLSGVEHRI